MTEFNEDLLHEYLDGTLDDQTRQTVEAHLARSPAARAQLAELEVLFASLDAVPELPLITDLSAGVVAQIQRETATLTPRWLWGLLLGQLLVALVLFGDLWMLLLDGLGNGREQVAVWSNTLQISVLTFFEQFWADTAVLFTAPTLPDLTINLPTGQWTLLFTLALLVWLAGNRLLFVND